MAILKLQVGDLLLYNIPNHQVIVTWILLLERIEQDDSWWCLNGLTGSPEVHRFYNAAMVNAVDDRMATLVRNGEQFQ